MNLYVNEGDYVFAESEREADFAIEMEYGCHPRSQWEIVPTDAIVTLRVDSRGAVDTKSVGEWCKERKGLVLGFDIDAMPPVHPGKFES